MGCRDQINAPSDTMNGSERTGNHFSRGYFLWVCEFWQELTWENGLDKRSRPSRIAGYIVKQ
jgi:hypothetical protein